MSDIYSKRMSVISSSGNIGEFLRTSTNEIEDMTFTNNINYKKGMLYDWDMNELEEVEFKFEKHKTFVSEEREVEYFIRFRPNYHPDIKYKDIHYKNDGRQRLGFYIDVPDYEEGTVGKWIITGKDDRSNLDRYNAFRCNWCFEWIDKNKKYHNILGALRDSNNSSAKDVNRTLLEGSIVSGATSFLIPSNEVSQKIDLGTRFMIGDRSDPPQVYEVIKITDTAPLGTTKVYLKQCMFNQHTDIQGDVNSMTDYNFYFDVPIDSLPDDFGKDNHSIAGGVRSKTIEEISTQSYDDIIDYGVDDISWELTSESDYIYLGDANTIIYANPSSPTTVAPKWHIFIDGEEYSYERLEGYFTFIEGNNILSIKCNNKIMVGYIIKIAIYDSINSYYDSIEMEVHM